ncbi:MAG: FAD-dependent oxidoreductase [Spirochaeta sp.]|nr:FAD-dependent oxidoreductase [Spirochaeta sp.]
MNGIQFVVVGGGFAGVQAVRAIRRRCRHGHIHLIDQSGSATMVPALPDLLSGRVRRAAMARPLEEIFDESVTRSISVVRRVDMAAQTVETETETVHYDALVLAQGSTPTSPPEILREHRVYTVNTLTAATVLRDAVADKLRLGITPHVVVVGAGYTGLETAVALRHGTRTAAAPRVTVVDMASKILSMLSARRREQVSRYIADQGIDLRTGIGVSNADAGSITLTDGTRITAPMICWAAGMRAAPIELAGEVEATRDARIETNAFLQVPGHPAVFVAGDAAALRRDGSVVRRAVNFAHYSGRRAGANAAAFVSGKRLRAFTPVDLGWVIPLGSMSVGSIFGGIPVGGALGLRMHYIMSGFRHFGGGRAGEFYRTAAHLRRQPEPLDRFDEGAAARAEPGREEPRA